MEKNTVTSTGLRILNSWMLAINEKENIEYLPFWILWVGTFVVDRRRNIIFQNSSQQDNFVVHCQ
jgi:hypothetical protein